MALIDPVPTTEADFGELTVDTLFTCREGLVGVSTDSAADGDDDYFWLAPGDSIQIVSGLTVAYIGIEGTVLHTMPVGV